MEDKELKQECLKLMESAALGYLGTVDGDGFPQIRAMANLRDKGQYAGLVEVFAGHDEDFLMYFATGALSAKMEHIRANPKVSVYFCDAEQMHTLLLSGSAEIVSDAGLKKALWQDGWEKHWPKGVDDAEYLVLCFRPVFVKGWYKDKDFEFSLS